ncbi:MAG TPA: helix-turn-helix domain-containing protein [Solirubrobacterales bacterium]|nr:helix-turn-helix domain-containing protein [Solirubrobacterales bacterium]
MSDGAAPKAVRFADDTTQQGFTQIPNAILRDSDLSAGARLTYALLSSFAWQADECWVGQAKLAKLAGVGDRQIRNYLGELEEGDLLETTRQGLHKPNLYTLFGAGPDRNCGSGQERNCVSDKEDTGEEDSANPPPPTSPTVKSKATEEIESVWATYVKSMNPRGRGRELDPEARKLIREALKVADVEELQRAIETCARSDFHMKRGKYKNRQGGKYNALAQIIKARRGRNETTRSRIEWWLDRAEEFDAGKEDVFDVNAEAERIRREQEAD